MQVIVRQRVTSVAQIVSNIDCAIRLPGIVKQFWARALSGLIVQSVVSFIETKKSPHRATIVVTRWGLEYAIRAVSGHC